MRGEEVGHATENKEGPRVGRPAGTRRHPTVALMTLMSTSAPLSVPETWPLCILCERVWYVKTKNISVTRCI